MIEQHAFHPFSLAGQLAALQAHADASRYDKPIGDAQERAERKARILDAIPYEAPGIRQAALIAAVRMSRDYVGDMLRELMKERLVCRANPDCRTTGFVRVRGGVLKQKQPPAPKAREGVDERQQELHRDLLAIVKRKKLSAERLAIILGMTTKHMQRVLRGERTVGPKLVTWMKGAGRVV